MSSSISSDYRLIISSPDGTKRRVLPSNQVISIDYTLERFGGYGDATIKTAIDYTAAQSVQVGDEIECYYLGLRRYRGYVSARVRSEEDPRKLTFTGYGVWARLRKQFTNIIYAFGSVGGKDVSNAYAQVGRDWLMPATGIGGINLIASVDAQTIGTSITSLDAKRKIAGDVIDSLVQQAGNLAIVGADVDPSGNNRAYIRPLKGTSPPTHVITVPSVNVESDSSEEQTGDIVNQLLVIGGTPQYPNILHNGDFELPVVGGGGAGNLIVNGSFELGSVDGGNTNNWYSSSGRSVKKQAYNSPSIQNPFDGTYFEELDQVGKYISQTTNVSPIAGHNYVLSARAGKEIETQTATGHATLNLYSAAGATGTQLYTTQLNLTPQGQAYDYFSFTFVMPAGVASFLITITCDSIAPVSGNQGGLMIDDVQFYDNDSVYQDGWQLQPNGTATVNAVNWTYRNNVYQGGYCVYANITSQDAVGQDVWLSSLSGSRFGIKAGQSIRFSCWMRTPPTSTTVFPKVQLEILWYGNDGNEINSPTVHAFPSTGASLTTWTYFELTDVSPNNATQGMVVVAFRGSGEVLVDAIEVRDILAPSSNGGFYLPEGNIAYLIKASDAYLNGTYRPSIGLSNPAPYANSETTYGPICGQINESSVIDVNGALAIADATFTTQAFPLFRPTVTLLNDARIYWPGDTVSLAGHDGPSISPTPLPISRIRESYDGVLRTTLELEKEQPDVSLVVKKIVQAELLKYGNSAGTSGSAGGYSSRSNNYVNGAGVSSNKVLLNSGDTAPDYLDAKIGVTGPLAVGDSAGVRTFSIPQATGSVSGFLATGDWTAFYAKEPGLGNPATSGYVLSSTTAGVRSWVVNAGTITVFGASGATHSTGLVPDPGATAGTLRYMREDGAWVRPKKRGVLMTLCAGFTPTATGGDVAELSVPIDPDSGLSITWNILEIVFRVGTAGGAPEVTVEKSTVAGAFTAAAVGSVTLATGANQGSNVTSLGTTTSGDVLRFNAVVLGTAANWTVMVVLGEP